MPRNNPAPQTPFVKAVSERNTRAALRIARRDPSVHELQLPTGYGFERALNAAVRLKSLALATVLLDQGMNVDIADD